MNILQGDRPRLARAHRPAFARNATVGRHASLYERWMRLRRLLKRPRILKIALVPNAISQTIRYGLITLTRLQIARAEAHKFC